MKTAECLLSIDIGTESARAALVKLDGEIVATSSKPCDLICPEPGWAEQPPDSWWEATVSNIRNVLEQAPGAEVLSVAVCGQMHAVVPLDSSGRLVTPSAILWCDKRSAPQCQELKQYVDESAAHEMTGNPVLPSWIGPKLRWMKANQPAVFDTASVFLTCKDYLNFRMTGAICTDYSEASGSWLFDIRSREWSPELCRVVGVETSKLPPIRDSATVIGKVTSEVEDITGLKAGTPVVCGGGDMMCLLLGAGIMSPGQACDVTGTAADISVYVTEPIEDTNLMHLHHVVPDGGWISFGILDAGGGSYRWFRDTFASAECAMAREMRVSPYEVLNELAAQTPPGAEGLFFLPYLLGERTLGSANSRGVFFGFTPRHALGHCVRAIMEGVAFDLRQTLDIIERMGIVVENVRAVGGGALSPLWCNIKSNIYSKPVVTLHNFEGGLVGAAILAGIGVGAYADTVDAVERAVRTKQTYFPATDLVEQYDRHYKAYRLLHDGLQPLYHEVAQVLK